MPGVGDFDRIKGEMKEVIVPDTSKASNKKIVELQIPYSVHIMAIKRNESYIQPTGSTIILAGDKLYLLADNTDELTIALQSLDINNTQL